MPSAAETFSGIAGQQQGPFSSYLDPVHPRAIDQPMAAPTGYESGPVAAGEIALSFLKGLRQNRRAQAAEEDAQTQTGLDNFRQHVNAQLQDPKLTDAGRQAILAEANGIMNQHMHYEMRDTPKHGVAGFFKNLLTQASGGPIKTREPINWDEATGRIANIANKPEHSQVNNFQQAITESQQAIEMLKRGNPEMGIAPNPNPSKEQVEQTLLPMYYKVLQHAPSYAGAFGQTMGMGFPGAGSVQWGMQELNRTAPGAAGAIPVTQPPPGTLEQYPANARGAAATAPPPGTAAAPEVRPADTGAAAPSGTATVQYEPGYGRDRFALLTNVAGHPNSQVQVSADHQVVTEGGRRLMAARVMGSTNPLDNGYWDTQTGQKIKGNVASVGVNTPHVVRRGQDDWAVVFDPNLGHEVFDLMPDPKNPTGQPKPYKIPAGAVQVVGPDGSVRWETTRSEAGGQKAGSQGLLSQRIAADFAMLPARDRMDVARTRRNLLTTNDTRLQTERLRINQTYDNWATQVRSRNIDIAVQGLSSLGMPVDQKVVQQALTNPKPLLDMIEQARQRQLGDTISAWQADRQSINDNFPEGPQTAAPPEPPRQKPRTAPPPAAPAAKGKVKLSDLPDK